MKRILYIFILAIFFICSACQLAPAQQLNTLSTNCPPTFLTKASIKLTTIGDINYTPCLGRSNLFNGIVNLSNATVILPGGGSPVSGTGTTNFIPRWTNGASGVLGNTPFSWNASQYSFNNTALNSEWLLEFFPSTAAGTFRVGDYTTTPTNYFELSQVSNAINGYVPAGTITLANSPTFTVGVQIDSVGNAILGKGSGGITFDSAAGNFTAGDAALAANRTLFIINDITHTFSFNSAGIGVFDFTGIINTQLNRTLTAAGTTGARTINLPNGSVNFAAAATTLVVTNSIATATSTINAMAQTNDATCHVKDVERAAGSFTIRMTAACTAETAVAFWVYN